MGRLCIAALTLSACLITFAAAQRQDEPTFRVDVKLVRLLATVKDNYGKPVGGLERGDFEILENGVRQQIALFERHTAQPLSVSVLLDISGSTAKEMKYQTEAVTRFIRALFAEGNPDDHAALYTFNWQIAREVPFTRNAGRFERAMKNLKAEAGTSLYDAILIAADDIVERDGRHVLVVITDGGDTVSSSSYGKAMRAVHGADAVMYPILTLPITSDAGRNVGGENALTTMARSTGGRMFIPGESGLDQAFGDILRDLRTQYLIGYYPKNVPATREPFHRITLKLLKPELRVETRTGYYGDSDTSGVRN